MNRTSTTNFMAKTLLRSSLFALSLGLATTASAGGHKAGEAHAAEKSKVSPVIAQVMDWWPGDYNNQRHLKELTEADKPIWREDDSGEGGHIEVESHYRAVEMPEFGDHVLYVEELKHGKPDLIFRQRIYTLAENDETGEVRVKLWYFNDKKKYIGAWKDLSLLDDLNKEGMFPLQDGCDLVVKEKDGKYHMAMPSGECQFGDKLFNYQVLLGNDSFWFRDRIDNAETGEPVSVSGDFTYHELDQLN